MRIAHITATFPPYYGGTGSVCYQNALELALRGHNVHVYTTEYPQEKYKYPPEFSVHNLPALVRFGNAPLLLDLLKIHNFDILHLHFPFYFSDGLINLISKLRNIPLVITYHQDVLLDGFKGLFAKFYDRIIGSWVLKSADKILFTTLDYGKNSKAKWLFRKYPARISSLPNGVDVKRFSPSLNGTIIRNRHHIKMEKTVLILVAGLDQAHYFKGVDVLLNALHMVNNESLHLIIVGHGDLRKIYQQMAKKLKIEDQVTFAGRVTDEELPLYYAASDIGILPSTTMGEAFGVVLLEAMACGKPVIASNLPGVRQLVKNDYNGYLSQPGDSQDLSVVIKRLVQNPELRRSLGHNAREFVQGNYAYDKIGDQLEEIYSDVISRKN